MTVKIFKEIELITKYEGRKGNSQHPGFESDNQG